MPGVKKGQKKKGKKVSPVIKPLFFDAKESEVEAYGFIRDQLRDFGWNVRDPSKIATGQVWTQNQCLAHGHIKAALGLNRPENIVKLSENRLWIIEAKAKRNQLDTALSEAVNDYALPINNTPGTVSAVLATGVAGNEELGYLIRTKVLVGGAWKEVTINGQTATGLLSPQQTKTLLESNDSDIHDFVPPQLLFLKAAERINAILHIGGINKNERAKTMAALLLSVIEEPPSLDTKLSVLIHDINTHLYISSPRQTRPIMSNSKPHWSRPFKSYRI